jgi:hypothetical protein
MRRVAFENVALSTGRDAHCRKGLAAIEHCARLGKRLSVDHHPDGAARIQHLDNVAAELTQVVVDDRDWNFAQDLGQIGLRIERTVNHRREHHE